MTVELLPEDMLVKTSDLDQGTWNYARGPLGAVQRKRFALAAGLLGHGHRSLLEIGYGSGIFMPELGSRCARLSGVDVHAHPAEVAQVLKGFGLGEVDLRCAPADRLPFADESFDAVVAVSTLEFVDDVVAVCHELRRVMTPGARGVFVTPGHSPLLDLGLRVLTGERAEDTFAGRRQAVRPALRGNFTVVREVRFPPMPLPRLYTALSVVRE